MLPSFCLSFAYIENWLNGFGYIALANVRGEFKIKFMVGASGAVSLVVLSLILKWCAWDGL